MVLYNTDIVIEVLVDQGMSDQEAWEYFDYNIIGAYMGDGTPAFATLCDKNS